jgi:hypothetical protein
MANQINGNQFREDEIVIMAHFDKREETWVRTVYPKIGGRLRLAHEENDQISITTEIVRYDETIAVVKANTTTAKGTFPGLGMASVDRDHTIAPAILELAETRAIARSLRFAGYGVEYCSAEEISHLQNGSEPLFGAGPGVPEPQEEEQKGGDERKPADGGNGDARVTNKQLNYIVNLGRNLNLNSKDLDEESVRVFGVKMAYLTVKDASSFIDILKSKAA